MKKIWVLAVLALFGVAFTLPAQTVNQDKQLIQKDKAAVKAAKAAEKKAAKEAKKARKEAEEAKQMAWYNAAVKAIESKDFVLEAERVEFKRGRYAYVTPSTNFVSLNGENASIQLSFNIPSAGANGLGGITVDGRASSVEITKDKKGNIHFKMMVQGPVVSASVSVRIPYGSNRATAVVSPNFNSNRVSFTGYLYPTEESRTFKGRSF